MKTSKAKTLSLEALAQSVLELMLLVGEYETHHLAIQLAVEEKRARVRDLQLHNFFLKLSSDLKKIRATKQEYSVSFQNQLVDFLMNLYDAGLNPAEQRRALSDHLTPLFPKLNIENLILIKPKRGRANTRDGKQTSQRIFAENNAAEILGLAKRADHKINKARTVQRRVTSMRPAGGTVDIYNFETLEVLYLGAAKELTSNLLKFGLPQYSKTHTPKKIKEICPVGKYGSLVPQFDRRVFAPEIDSLELELSLKKN